jgi:hypothetical protein
MIIRENLVLSTHIFYKIWVLSLYPSLPLSEIPFYYWVAIFVLDSAFKTETNKKENCAGFGGTQNIGFFRQNTIIQSLCQKNQNKSKKTRNQNISQV